MKLVAENKRARFEYELLETFENGKQITDYISDKNNKMMGYTDTMKLVNVSCDKKYLGQIVDVKITDVKTWSMDGVIVDD